MARTPMQPGCELTEGLGVEPPAKFSPRAFYIFSPRGLGLINPLAGLGF